MLWHFIQDQDLQLIREAKWRQEMSEREATSVSKTFKHPRLMVFHGAWRKMLLRKESCLNMKYGVEEIMWQMYTGELSPEQEKTIEEILKGLVKSEWRNESNKRRSHNEQRIAKFLETEC
ncbi:uncharacterized protein LOC108816227 isoform X4 [Raphanus sativus]|uniref:Uncharacterized protein LOC108816227 isoform X4 n=1 Tax=Raphanus sativus TaxID=3726 RepID=A0A9W3C5A2_RAPSA|nr:uncharacterized protein LOC108816227 isoform X4 [Raphanus sativus]